jgi:predicted ribosomally synthesized peptide with SipW-like signal peptide
MKALAALKSVMSLKVVLMGVMSMAVAGGLIGGGLFAYFNDTETATNNTFTAGTIDIAVNGQNPWQESFHMEVKPCEVDYINFEVENVGTNPVDVWKKIIVTDWDGGEPMYPPQDPLVSSEPELEAEGGMWVPGQGWDLSYWEPQDFIFEDTRYDIYSDWCTIYEEDEVYLADIAEWDQNPGYWLYLGQVEPQSSMFVEQSYHLYDTGYPQNEWQGDTIYFDVELYAQQISGNVQPPGLEWGWCSKGQGPYGPS